jgi:iron complex outermembrane receptor protein
MRIASIAAASSLGMLLGHSAGATGTGDSEALEQVVVTGTRVANRSVLETAAPVDVILNDQLQNLGITEVNQALAASLPSFNFPRPGLADGTDAVRPATLRGLSPDQTLVLVNSKRLHSAALVNVNGTIGRGASAPDLNTIPSAIVQSVEVLRDGASAQYGSDAIAGVVNLRLREARDGGGTDLTYGWRDTDFDVRTAPVTTPGATWSAPPVLSRSRSDGETLTASIWKGLPLTDSGFLTVAAEYKDQDHTERGGWDHRSQYAIVGGVPDPREATFDRFNSWYGEPEVQQKTLFANAGYDVSDAVALYGWASWQDRHSVGAGFYRPAGDARNIPSIYPDGFLPLIAADVSDYSAAFGTRWELGAWQMDTSLVYGLNKMDFTIDHTLNRSIGPTSKTKFDAGGFDYDQLVLNFSGVRPVEVSAFASPLNIAVGLEARRETYSIFAGEPDSFRNGGETLNGTPTAPGAQVFPGFRPSNEVDEDRTAVGAYVDLEANLTQALLASIAVRGESYSDFGDNLSGKLSMRYDFNEHFALRGSVQNGFRAPSLQQQFFQTTSTNNIPGVGLVEVTTFPASDPIARALGARDLDAEKSKNFSVGAVLRLGQLDITVDAYRIDIDDRIVLSENLVSQTVAQFLTTQGFIGVGGGRFFINGVDTRTEGVDVVVNYPLETTAVGRFDFALAANFNSTDVTKVPEVRPTGLNPPPVLFDHLNILTFEEGTPEDKVMATVSWTMSRFGLTVRATRYGDALAPGTTAATDFTLTAKTLVDLEARFDITDRVRAGIGADNLTDEYPDQNPPALNPSGTQSFSNYSPFGRSGRFVYGKLNYRF